MELDCVKIVPHLIVKDETEITIVNSTKEKSVGIENDRAAVENITSNDCVKDSNVATGESTDHSVMGMIDNVQKSVIGNEIGVVLADGSPTSGSKRMRMTCLDQEPCVHIVYNFLSRESVKKLKDCLQEWSEWHAQQKNPVSGKNMLEYGEETYFPALPVDEDGSAMVTFWVDNLPRKAPTDNDAVPLYDRGFVLGSNSTDGTANLERFESLEASRCFNCGSYSHSVKECPKPRDNVLINSARKQHGVKKNPNSCARGQSRYYISSNGKFDDLKPGVLGFETRQCLGIGEFDPPPWLQRMREIGYPPGYLDAKNEDQPSGINIFVDEEQTENEEGELLEGGESALSVKKKSVEFPGVNAPIPENADHRQWEGPSSNGPIMDTWHRYHQSPSSAEVNRSHNKDQRRSRENGEWGHHASDHLLSSSSHGYSFKHSPYEHSPIPSTPTFSRSQSDRGWRSPLGLEGSPGYGYQTPSYYSRSSPHHHSPASSDRWDPYGTYHGSSNSSSHGRDRNHHDYNYRFR